MFLSFLYIVILMIQGFIFFSFLYLPLSLWNVSLVVPALGAFIMLVVQIFLAYGVISRFFPSLPPKDESDGKFIQDRVEFVNEILKKGEVLGVRSLVFADSIPFIISFGDFLGKKKSLVVSTGLFHLLTPEESGLMIEREGSLLGDMNLGLFTAAAFLPFALFVLSAWLFESARLVVIGRSTGTPNLAGVLVLWFSRLSEFFLLFLSRFRHRVADGKISSQMRPLFCGALEKMADEFVKPPGEGVLFRKRVLEGLRVFLPFDPFVMEKYQIWRMFISSENFTPSLFQTGRLMEFFNYYTKAAQTYSSHSPVLGRFVVDGEEVEKIRNLLSEEYKDLLINSKRDYRLGRLPLALFLFSLPFMFLLKGFFGIPMILASFGFIYRLWFWWKEGRRVLHWQFEDFGVCNFGGILTAFSVPRLVESSYFFVSGDEKAIPLILRQMFRSEEPLLYLQGERVHVEGVFRVGEVPYLQSKTIFTENPKIRPIRSGYMFTQGFIALVLLMMGLIFVLFQYSVR